MSALGEKANQVANDPDARGVWIIGVAAVAVLVVIAVTFRDK